MNQKFFKANIRYECLIEICWTKKHGSGLRPFCPLHFAELPNCLSASAISSQCSKSCHSSACNSPLASIPLQGKSKAWSGPTKLYVWNLPDRVSSSIWPLTHTHTRVQPCGTLYPSWNMLDTPLSEPLVLACLCPGCPSQVHDFLGSFLKCHLLSNALSAYPLPQSWSFFLTSVFPGTLNTL